LIDVLGEMRATPTVLYLLRPALSEKSDPQVRAAASAALVRILDKMPSRDAAVALLVQQAQNYFTGRETPKTDTEGRAISWRWDAAAKKVVETARLPEEAARLVAARLAGAALDLSPSDPKTQVFCHAAILDEAAWRAGLDKPLDLNRDPAARRIASLGPPAIEAILKYAMAENHPAAAKAAIEILGRAGNAKQLLCQGATPSPLVQAVRSPDRRVRLAALEAIVGLKPDCPFAGSSHVLESLAQLAATGGTRRAILVGPNADALQEWIGQLASSHIQPDVVTTSREAMRLAQHSPDYELVLIDTALADADALVQQLRQDYRTADLRVGLIARSGDLDRAERIAREDDRAMAFSRPRDRRATEWQSNRLAGVAPLQFIGFEERQREAAQALDCLALLVSTSRKLFDVQQIDQILARALYVPGLGVRAAAVLANIGTHQSQTDLVELASRVTQPLAAREAAAKAFAVNTQRYGLLLRRDAIRRQYERYKQSEGQDEASRQVFKNILDSIEAKGKEPRTKESPGTS